MPQEKEKEKERGLILSTLEKMELKKKKMALRMVVWGKRRKEQPGVGRRVRYVPAQRSCLCSPCTHRRTWCAMEGKKKKGRSSRCPSPDSEGKEAPAWLTHHPSLPSPHFSLSRIHAQPAFDQLRSNFVLGPCFGGHLDSASITARRTLHLCPTDNHPCMYQANNN